MASSVVLVTTQPVFVVIGSWLLFRERISRLAMLGMACWLSAGSFVIGASDFQLDMRAFWGDLLALTAAIMVSGYLLIGRRLRNSVSLPAYTFFTYGSSSLALILASLARRTPFAPYPLRDWVLFLALAVGLHYSGAYCLQLGVAICPGIGGGGQRAGRTAGGHCLGLDIPEGIPNGPAVYRRGSDIQRIIPVYQGIREQGMTIFQRRVLVARKKTGGSVQRVREALATAGLANEVQELADSTRSARDAALAVGCDVAQIVKSLVMKGAVSGKLFLVLTSGGNRVCVERVATLAGEEVVMADAALVREWTGFAIGGVPPLGHLKPLPTFIDEDLTAHRVVWAAAGSPHALFHLTPDDLLRITGGMVTAVAEKE